MFFAIASLSKTGAKPALSDTPHRKDICLLFSAAWRIAAAPLIGSFECPTAYYMGMIRESFYPLHSNQRWLLFPKGLSISFKCLGSKEVALVLCAADSSITREKLRFQVSNVFPHQTLSTPSTDGWKEAPKRLIFRTRFGHKLAMRWKWIRKTTYQLCLRICSARREV